MSASGTLKLNALVNNIQNDFDRELRLSELREQMLDEMERIQALEAKMQAQMHEMQQEKIFEDTGKRHIPRMPYQKYLTTASLHLGFKY